MACGRPSGRQLQEDSSEASAEMQTQTSRAGLHSGLGWTRDPKGPDGGPGGRRPSDIQPSLLEAAGLTSRVDTRPSEEREHLAQLVAALTRTRVAKQVGTEKSLSRDIASTCLLPPGPRGAGSTGRVSLGSTAPLLSSKEVRELGLVILVDARKSLAAPALSRALAALQVSRWVLSWGSELLQAQGVSSRRLPLSLQTFNSSWPGSAVQTFWFVL
ncbi:hypothetical protein J1605_020834 [Eschrichtius robustus]|uniref:Uncharacterized protein n=1 Tax=Eschrichtius robustus TaxID=9764 RepID=A0AB34HKU8_ESCRO|nr:hypothetical protein J1605_020834 [Eschrichtius robustus]